MIRKSKREFERNIGIQSQSNPKILWSHVRSSLKPKPVWHLSYRMQRMKLKQNLTTRKRRIFFKNNLLVFFTKEQNPEVPVLDKKTEVNLPNMIITEEMVLKKILKSNVNKSSRPDEIHLQILIKLVDLVSKPLALLLNKTMDEGCIPQD